MSIEVLNESGAAVDEQGLVTLARHVLDGMGIHPLAELSVLLVDEAAMTELHVKWMGEDGPTDVLAFPMHEPRTARAYGRSSSAPCPPPPGPPLIPPENQPTR